MDCFFSTSLPLRSRKIRLGLIGLMLSVALIVVLGGCSKQQESVDVVEQPVTYAESPAKIRAVVDFLYRNRETWENGCDYVSFTDYNNTVSLITVIYAGNNPAMNTSVEMAYQYSFDVGNKKLECVKETAVSITGGRLFTPNYNCDWTTEQKKDFLAQKYSEYMSDVG